jgi:hypothetical protein
MLRQSPFIDARHLDEVTAEIARLLDIPPPQSKTPILV